jgi:hypothetical protein
MDNIFIGRRIVVRMGAVDDEFSAQEVNSVSTAVIPLFAAVPPCFVRKII